MFTRTSGGISSQHLFYRVDFVVYCEGKARDDGGSSLDELFWQRLLGSFGVSCHCKSSGSKSVLMPMVDRIKRGEVKNTLVALDRDYDDLLGREISDPHVLYTFGYSWESDIVIEMSVDAAVGCFATIADTREIAADYVRFWNLQSCVLRRPTLLDVKYFDAPGKLFDRNKPRAIVSTIGGSVPSIDRRKLLVGARKMNGFVSPKISPRLSMSICGATRFFGKSFAMLVFEWFVAATKAFATSVTPSFEQFARLAILTSDFSNLANARNAYYQKMVSRIPAP